MRRLTILTVLIAFVAAPTADASFDRFLQDGGDSLSLKRGRGVAIIRSREGAVLGTIARGRVVVSDYRRGARTTVEISGCETRRRLGPRTVLCAGRELSFYVVGGAWRAGLRGRGINASAVLRGAVTFDDGVAGTYSINHEDAEPWPEESRTFTLG